MQGACFHYYQHWMNGHDPMNRVAKSYQKTLILKLKLLQQNTKGSWLSALTFTTTYLLNTSLSTSIFLLPSYLVQGGHSMTVIHKFGLVGNQTHTHRQTDRHTHTHTHTHLSCLVCTLPSRVTWSPSVGGSKNWRSRWWTTLALMHSQAPSTSHPTLTMLALNSATLLTNWSSSLIQAFMSL